MKYISAYVLCVLGGNTNPSTDDVASVLSSVGAHIEHDKIVNIVESLRGKALHELIEAGNKKMATFSLGGSGNVEAAKTTVKTAEVKVAEPEKKAVAEKPAEEVDMGIGLFGEEEEY